MWRLLSSFKGSSPKTKTEEKKTKKPIGKFNEGAWLTGQILISLAVALITKSNFGVSSVVAPAYIIHLKMSEYFSWYTFGTSEYIFQGLLLITLFIAIKKFKPKFLFSFLTACFYGFFLDIWFKLLGTEYYTVFYMRCISFAFGVILTSLAVAFLFRSYLPQQVYEQFVFQFSKAYKLNTNKFKYIYDLSSLLLAITLTLIFNHSLKGIGAGTIICAVANAPLITFFGKILDKFIDFSARFPKVEKFFNT